MTHDRSKFGGLTSLAKIKEQVSASSNSDGEHSWFELKSVEGTKWSTTAKGLIAKEVCAFANTYGGVLCLHGVPDIETRLNATLLSQIDALEGFLKDCLEPRLQGIAVKEVEGRFVIDVPESRTKPHRSSTKGKQYYYRHATSSQPMEEVMIARMYQDGRAYRYLAVAGHLRNEICKDYPTVLTEFFGSIDAASKEIATCSDFSKVVEKAGRGTVITKDIRTYVTTDPSTFEGSCIVRTAELFTEGGNGFVAYNDNTIAITQITFDEFDRLQKDIYLRPR